MEILCLDFESHIRSSSDSGLTIYQTDQASNWIHLIFVHDIFMLEMSTDRSIDRPPARLTAFARRATFVGEIQYVAQTVCSFSSSRHNFHRRGGARAREREREAATRFKSLFRPRDGAVPVPVPVMR